MGASVNPLDGQRDEQMQRCQQLEEELTRLTERASWYDSTSAELLDDEALEAADGAKLTADLISTIQGELDHANVRLRFAHPNLAVRIGPSA